MEFPVFGLAMQKAIPLVHTESSTPTQKITLAQDVTFIQMSYNEYTKVKKPVVITTSYEASDKEEEPETVPVVINNSYVNVVSDSETNSIKKDFKNNNDHFFDKDIDDQVKATPQTTVNAKWYEL